MPESDHPEIDDLPALVLWIRFVSIQQLLESSREEAIVGYPLAKAERISQEEDSIDREIGFM